jgi:hypothetical protein
MLAYRRYLATNAAKSKRAAGQYADLKRQQGRISPKSSSLESDPETELEPDELGPFETGLLSKLNIHSGTDLE